MAQRFRRKDASVEAGFRRIALAEIDAAIATIDDRRRADTDKVHKVRRHIKALCALLRLLRPGFDRYRKENRKLRDLARALSHLCDAEVPLDTFDAIAGIGKGRVLSRGFVALRERLAAVRDAHGDLRKLLDETRRRLVKARAAKRELDARGWDAIGEGLSRSYRHAREAMGETLKSSGARASNITARRCGCSTRCGPIRCASVRSLRRSWATCWACGTTSACFSTLWRRPGAHGDVVTVTHLAGFARLRPHRLDLYARRPGEKPFEHKAEKVAGHSGVGWDECHAGNG